MIMFQPTISNDHERGQHTGVNGLGSTLFGLEIIIRFEEVGWYLLFCIIEGDYFVRLRVNFDVYKVKIIYSLIKEKTTMFLVYAINCLEESSPWNVRFFSVSSVGF